MPNDQPWSQRRVASELRYAIDIARASGLRNHWERVKVLVETYPAAIRSRHVHHNLGMYRRKLLREHGIIDLKERTDAQAQP